MADFRSEELMYKIKWLNETQHTGVTTANIAIPLEDSAFKLRGDPVEICFLGLGVTSADIEAHIERQRRVQPWRRKWICNPNEMDSVKIILVPYRSLLDHAISTYTTFGVPTTELNEADIPLLIRDVSEIVVGEHEGILLWRMSLFLDRFVPAMRQAQYDETMRLLIDPPSAENACWLLNDRDRLYGRRVCVEVKDLHWAVKVTNWDVLACKAIHRDGNAIVFEGRWKSMPLEAFWHQYCGPLKVHLPRALEQWKRDVWLANERKSCLATETHNSDDDDGTFIPDDD